MYQALDRRAHVAALRPAAVQSSNDLLNGPRRLEQFTEGKAIGRLHRQPRSPRTPRLVERLAARLGPRGDDILPVAVPGVAACLLQPEALRAAPLGPRCSRLVVAHGVPSAA